MKRWIVCMMIALAAAGGAAAQSLQGKTMYIGLRTAALKSSTGFFASTRGTLQQGDAVTVLQQKGNWAEVRASARPTLTGWVSVSSLTTKRTVASGGATSASAQELALAGKGFDQEVENAYKQNGKLDYTGIDAMEAQKVAPETLLLFLVEGHLAQGGEK